MKRYGWRNPEEQRESYAYDGLRRLAGVNIAPLKNNGSAVAMSYAYDAVGNRLSWATDDDLSTQQPGDGFSKNYAYNAANQLLRAETKSLTPNPNRSPVQEYRYDGNGSRIGRTERDSNGPVKGTDYSFDPENRLIRALDYQLTGKGGRNRIDRAVTALDYDGGGRRLAQSYDPKAGKGGVKRTEYAFDKLDPVAEYNQLNGQYDNYYRGADDQIITSQHFSSGAVGQLHWYHYDRKGDVAGLTKQNGNAAHTYRYEPYGAVIPANGNFTDPHNHYTLTGKEFDENTGLVWFGARHYEPETGIWMGQDSHRGRLDEPGSLHRFGYVLNNPVTLWDWYGFFDVENGVVERGDTLIEITKRINSYWGTSYTYLDIAKLNKISDADKISIGEKVIPNKEIPDVSVKLYELMRKNSKDDCINNPICFKKRMETKGDWDLKAKDKDYYPDKHKKGFVFYGAKIRYDAPGNIHFGYLGESAFWVKDFPLIEDFIGLLFYGASKEQQDASTTSEKYCGSVDDPVDEMYIHAGIAMAKECKNNSFRDVFEVFNKTIKEYGDWFSINNKSCQYTNEVRKWSGYNKIKIEKKYSVEPDYGDDSHYLQYP